MLRFLLILLVMFAQSFDAQGASGEKKYMKSHQPSKKVSTSSTSRKRRYKTATSKKVKPRSRYSRARLRSKKVEVEKTPVPQVAELDGSTFESVGPFTSYNESNYFLPRADAYKSVLTLDREMQAFSEEVLKDSRVPWGAIVALDPQTGAVMALAGHSSVQTNGQSIATRNTFPAASLFKIITAAAAVETSGYDGDTEVAFRGGTYSLGKHNYLPNRKSDKRRMSLGLALGKSCNPVFARVALNDLSTDVIKKYAKNFGFSKEIAKDFPLKPSTLTLEGDSYSLARTAAGFGAAYISPVHAAVIAGAVGNSGLMMRPYIVDHINDPSGRSVSKTRPELLAQSVSSSTAQEVLDMMTVTVSEGTARKHFRKASPLLQNISVAGKTGTLKGQSPKGLYHWFVAVAPVENPKVAIATLVIDNGRARINGVGLGKKYLERYFANESATKQAKSALEKPSKSSPVS